MTELEWCRANAPDAIKGLPDDQLVEIMHSSYERFCNNNTNPAPTTDTLGYDLTDKQQRLSHLLITATNVLQDKIAFKGGFLLSYILGDIGRLTKDVDFDVADQKAYDYLKPYLRALGDYYVSTGLATEYKIREDLSGDKSGGFTVYDNNAIILKCDICSGNLSYGLVGYEIEGHDVQSFSVERILVDKVLALLSIKRFRRAKDIYDVYCLTNCFKCDARLINRYMRMRLKDTSGLWDEFPYTEDILQKMEKAYEKLKLLNISNETIPKPSWVSVADRFMVFAEKVRSPHDPYLWDNSKELFV